MRYYGTLDGKHFGFFKQEIQRCVSISDERFWELMEKQALGQEIVPNADGYPTPFDPKLDYNRCAFRVREKRDNLLKESDFHMLSDCPHCDVEAWKKYRQELRDISKQEKFPFEVNFPEKPEK